ncbi:hypothetical protein PR202_ga31472 [Eleusine coracana subsp. coracana]|uniref:UBX domain-containing protein n=1 Tax=Eleusine coracana subsp. coracana TaxID=191504 RepID=A0AAV5DT89_ELECO|nr:hypothetical protein PR202_ga31472 [Eleusine coracana subsp. coracana]
MDDFLIGSFMEFTGCAAPEDAAHHLASCGWKLDEAVNLFFSVGAGTSGSGSSSSRSPLRSPVADAEDGVRAPIPALSDTLYGRADDEDAARRPTASSGGGPSRAGSRWDSQTRVSNNNRRRNRNNRQRRRNRLREDDDGDDRRQRRRVDDGDTGMEVDADHTSPLRLYDRFLNNSGNNNSNNDKKKEKEKEDDLQEMFRPPDELTFKGGFHDAKSYAARGSRWLLVNVQDTGEFAFASFAQNRDVWKSELVAQHVRDHFVLWRVDAAEGLEAEEARKVCCYYKLPLDKMPAVVVVDPVTGQAMATLQGASTDPNDFLVAMRPYVTSKPVVPAARATKKPASSSSSSVANEPVKQGPVKMTSTPTSSQRTERRQEQLVAPIEKQAKPVASAVPTTVQPAPIPTPAPPAPKPAFAPPAPTPAPLVGKVCKLRVRLPGGRVVTKEFGSGSAISALFAYCCTELVQGEAGNKNKPFRLMRLVGSTREEIADPTVFFEDSGLHLSTVPVLLG